MIQTLQQQRSLSTSNRTAAHSASTLSCSPLAPKFVIVSRNSLPSERARKATHTRQHRRRAVFCMASKNSILWFRKGLRLHDNHALLEACKDVSHMYPIFIIDPYFVTSGKYKVTVNRYNFLLESLEDLNKSLMARGSRLLVLRGTPEEVLPRVVKDWNISKLCYEIDTEPYAKVRDAKVSEMMTAAGVDFKGFWNHTLYDHEALLSKCKGGKPPLTMAAFTKLVDSYGPPPRPADDPPAQLPPPAPAAPGTEPEATTVPTWQEMGFKEAPVTIFKGGETEGLKRLELNFTNTAWVAAFEKPATDPSAFMKPATTVLSPYLKFGCVSSRLFHQKLLEVYKKHPKHSQPPQSLRGQLLWREFFYTVGAHTPNFDRMAGNPICKQIDWDTNPEHLAAWKEGRTGFPWIDAIMIQLKEWGWMHHLARHSVACFLTRGDLYISWEEGRDVFEEYLIDQDHYVNSANWMWLSASAFFNQYFRVYSPIAFGKKYDPNGNYIRRFLPVLKDYPSKYIYEPWTAPLDVQRKAGCIIGKDYPKPIVDHSEASKKNISRIAAAYKASKAVEAGDDDGGDEDEKPKKAAAAKKATAAKKSADSTSEAKAKTSGVRRGRAAAAEAAADVADVVKTEDDTVFVASTKAKGARGGKRQKTLQETGMKPVAK